VAMAGDDGDGRGQRVVAAAVAVSFDTARGSCERRISEGAKGDYDLSSSSTWALRQGRGRSIRLQATANIYSL
jgi:hypothetical protein